MVGYRAPAAGSHLSVYHSLDSTPATWFFDLGL